MLTIMIKESMEATLQRFGAEIAEKVVNICADKYGFTAEDAYLAIGDIRLNRQPKENAKPRRAVLVKPSFPLPYSGEYDENKCHALRQNQGLYTQCQTAKLQGSFCNQCHKLSKKSETGVPEYGLIVERKQAYDANEVFVDPRGHKETPYYKIMNRYKLTIEQVNEEAEKFGITVNPMHFAVPESGRRGRPAQEKVAKEPKGSKGRPKKEKKVIQIEGEDDDDLFAALVASANSDDELDLVSEKNEKEAKRLQEKAEREAKLAAEKAEKEAKRAAEKEARELKLAQEKAEKEAREAKRLQEKAEREAKLAAEKAERDAKEAKRIQEKAEKEAKLAAEKAEKEAKRKEAKKPMKKEEDDDDEPEVVKKITFNDKKYLLSKKSLIIYDYEKYVKEQEQVVVGKWNETEQKIVFNSSEESEDEYDSDDDEEEMVIGGGVRDP